ncbi:hypothetical protein ACFONE_10045, partial [Xanthomonas dyei]|uniref:hypothetical protein n=1 Tax=Xanthomonas dyei TaxID=743699 RepID=UPI003616C02E
WTPCSGTTTTTTATTPARRTGAACGRVMERPADIGLAGTTPTLDALFGHDHDNDGHCPGPAH